RHTRFKCDWSSDVCSSDLTLEALSYVARYLNPPDFDQVMTEIGDPDQVLHTARSHLTAWPADFAHIRIAFDTAAEAALASFAGQIGRASCREGVVVGWARV